MFKPIRGYPAGLLCILPEDEAGTEKSIPDSIFTDSARHDINNSFK